MKQTAGVDRAPRSAYHPVHFPQGELRCNLFLMSRTVFVKNAHFRKLPEPNILGNGRPEIMAAPRFVAPAGAGGGGECPP